MTLATAWMVVATAATAAVAASQAAPPATSPDPQVIHLPAQALVPDVLLDGAGVLHMVYGLGDYALYVRSSDNGATFSQPVRVNHTGTKVQLTMGERGPKLGLGGDGAIHVVWVDRWSPGAKCYVRLSRSVDGGKSFEPARQVSPMSGVDGATMAADAQGNVLVFWHVYEEPNPAERDAHRIYLAQSSDNGATFGPAERLNIAAGPALACSMCMMRARIGGDGNVYLAFRTADKDIRDFWLLRSRATENAFTAIRMNEDNWQIDHCPMCGPELTLAGDGRALCAFMSRHRVYWSSLDAGASAARLHVATPAGESDEIYPLAIANRQGQVLMVWQVGPMSVSGRATVKWAIYGADGQPTGRQGTIGVSTSGTKAAAVVGTDDQFRIVTTAR